MWRKELMIREISKQKEIANQYSMQDDLVKTNPYFEISLMYVINSIQYK